MMEISASKLDAFIRCPLLYKMRYVDMLEPEAVSPALALDSALHGSIRYFWRRLQQAGAGVDDVNLYQGRRETILERHYTTNQWFICQQCRWWVDKMFGDKPGLQVVR